MATKRVGRPPVGPRQEVHMTPEMRDDLDLIAALMGISRSEVIRRALALGLARMKRKAAA